jgi:hypothetical protein
MPASRNTGATESWITLASALIVAMGSMALPLRAGTAARASMAAIERLDKSRRVSRAAAFGV